MQDAAYWISVSHLKQWTNRQINELITRIFHRDESNFQAFFALSESDWQNQYELDEKRIATLKEAKAELPNNAFLAENLFNQGFELIAINSPDYSPALKDNLKLSYSPPLLYVKGNKEILKEDTIAIVGSRNASENGLQFTHNVAKKATEEYRVVVSGFAKGIDKAALDYALKYKGHSIIVLPQGVLTFGTGYKTYYKQIIEGDLLVLSTFHPKSPWRVELAMARNPIIYGLAKEIYVADSANSGGTWSGVKDGLRKQRVIYIRKATETENSANNILIDMGGKAVDLNGLPVNEEMKVESDSTQFLSPDKLHQRIIELLGDNSLSAKDLCLQLGLDISPQKMVAKLGKMDELEKIKVGKSVKFALKPQEIFDLTN